MDISYIWTTYFPCMAYSKMWPKKINFIIAGQSDLTERVWSLRVLQKKNNTFSLTKSNNRVCKQNKACKDFLLYANFGVTNAVELQISLYHSSVRCLYPFHCNPFFVKVFISNIKYPITSCLKWFSLSLCIQALIMFWLLYVALFLLLW